jgi:hypothetical protein
VFPAVNLTAVNYLSEAHHRGERTVSAASVSNDIAEEWGKLHHLPSIYDENFPLLFQNLATAYSIDKIFCPVASVHNFITNFLLTHHSDIKLIGQSPVPNEIEKHRQLISRANRLLPLVELCADGLPTLSLLEIAGVLRQASFVYGESNDDKLAALMGVFANAPVGDVIEIGSLMGRTAFVLSHLATRHHIGPLLTVDPWLPGNAIQRDSPGLVTALGNDWDFEVLSEGFFVNMMPFSFDRHAHLRLPSEAAFKLYSTENKFQSRSGHCVNYSGRIAVIHIDGNHDYSCVKLDCELWLDRMLPGAWLILDDYIWLHGDGPHRVGDDLLMRRAQDFECSFVCGKALFIKFRC